MPLRRQQGKVGVLESAAVVPELCGETRNRVRARIGQGTEEGTAGREEGGDRSSSIEKWRMLVGELKGRIASGGEPRACRTDSGQGAIKARLGD